MCTDHPEVPAVAKFLWSYGDEGFCCSQCQFLLNQRAGNIKQAVSFSPLALVEPMLERSERTQLIAAKLSAEGEADEVKRRAAKLYEANQELAKQVARAETMLEETKAMLKDRDNRIAQVGQDRDRYARQAGELALQIEQNGTRVAEAAEAEAQLQDLRDLLEAERGKVAALLQKYESTTVE
jgi:DNA repair exonuclease SbcCD ATPase subunit